MRIWILVAGLFFGGDAVAASGSFGFGWEVVLTLAPSGKVGVGIAGEAVVAVGPFVGRAGVAGEAFAEAFLHSQRGPGLALGPRLGAALPVAGMNNCSWHGTRGLLAEAAGQLDLKGVGVRPGLRGEFSPVAMEANALFRPDGYSGVSVQAGAYNRNAECVYKD